MRSILDYGSIICDPYQRNYIEKLEHVQRQAARFISNDYQLFGEGCATGMLQTISVRKKHCSINRLVVLKMYCYYNVLWLFITVPWIGLQYVIVVFPDHTHLLFCLHV